jgi:hypothetical protein
MDFSSGIDFEFDEDRLIGFPTANFGRTIAKHVYLRNEDPRQAIQNG